MAKKASKELRPQAGFQEEALMCCADIAVIGGAAGGGKTWTLLADPLRYITDKNFAAVYFRRTMSTIRATGGLWDESMKMYPNHGGNAKESILKWTWPSGAHIDFEGIEYEKDLANWQGTQMPVIIFDELTEFTKKMFFFMMSRNRGICSVKPYIRCSCNPDPNSWVRDFLAWWIDQETGYPIDERCGVLRYMIVYKDEVVWGSSPDDVMERCPQAFVDTRLLESGIDPRNLIKSVTFIAGDIYNNKILLDNDPGYLGSLNAMDEADQERFLRGNWNRSSDGMELFEPNAIDRLFTNNIERARPILVGYERDVPIFVQPDDYRNNFITCDAARFGRDLCVIMVWRGWEVIHITIFHQSDPHDIVREIEELRVSKKVTRLNVCVDQDGVGGDTVKFGRYYGFRARNEVARDPDTKVKENYKTRKDQCFFRFARRVNNGDVAINLNPQTCKIYDKGAKNPRWSTTIKIKGETIDVSILIKKHLNAIKRGESTLFNGELKLCVNEKEEQKESLNGASPDFADTLMMREDFVLRTISTGKIKYS
jgi:hypothetical protein